MSSITVKLISVACVLALLLTGIQAMTYSAAATETDVKLVTDPSAKKRLTISDSSARDPETVTSGAMTHLVWIDSSDGGDAIFWKRTSGDGVYTSSEALSQRFENIVVMDVSADGEVVVIAYSAVSNGTAAAYIVCSSDHGQSWGSNYLLGESDAVAVSVLGDRAFICMAAVIEGNDTVAVVGVDIEDGAPVNGTMLVALPFEASLVDVLGDEEGVHYTAAADDPCVVIYGHIGEELSQPVMIHGQSEGEIADVKLMSSNGSASALIASNLAGGSIIFLAESFDGPTHWSENVLANGEGRFSDLSYASYDDSIVVAWANSSSTGAIEALELRDDQATRTWKVIEGAVSSPSVFVENDGISCTWAEDCGSGAELYTISNIQFRVASFDQLLTYVAGLDEAAFRPDIDDAREHLLDDLENISSNIRLGDAEGAEDAIVHVMGHIDGFVVLSQSDDLLLSTSVCENIYGKLQAVRNEIRSVGLHSDPFTRWAISFPAEHGAVPAMAAFDTGASPSLATIRGCINVMSVSGEPGGDAPGTLAEALTVEPGRFTGSVNSSDTTDCFELKVYNPPYHNQMIYVDLDVPSGFNLNMRLYTPSGTLVRTAELGTGEDEHIEYLSAYEGYHVIQIYWVSGSGTASYEVKAEVAGGLDYFYLDVGASGDTTVNTPGLSVLDGGGWGSAANSQRIGSSNSTMLLNLFSASYQSNTSYLVGFQYTASSEVTVSVYNGGGWVDIGALPGRSAIGVANIIVPSEHLYDALPEVAGMNVMIRFSSSLALDFVDAVAYSYTTGAAPGTSYHNPGVGFESGWMFDGAVANGTAGATMLVNVPVQTMIFSLEIAYSDLSTYIEVQQLTSLGYVSIGSLYRWGGSAVILLKRDYYDADASAPGYNIRLKFVSSIVNVTSVTMRPCDLYTMVGGVYDDSGRYRNPGINIYNNGHWSSAASDNGRTYRTTLDGNALSFVNGAVSGTFHEVELVYRSSSSFTVSQWTGSSFINVATMPASASWTTASFRIDPSNFVDYMWGTQLNILFKIGTASVSVAEFHLLIDSDNDGAVDRMEADRTAWRYLDPFSEDTDSDGLKDIDEGYFGTIYGYTSPWDPDTDDDGLLDGAEKWSQSWSTESMMKVNGGTGGGYTSNSVYLTLPAIPSTSSTPITAIWVHVGLMHQHPDQIRVVIYKGGDPSNNHLMDREGTGTSLFRSWNLFDYGYDASDLATVSEWGLYIDDWSSTGGQLQYYIVQVEGRTNPLDSDSDDDGLSDGEEVNLGTDGWTTNPVLKDTDDDWIWDSSEIMGSTPCGKALDPTSGDTDGDGFNDNVDKYLGDMMLHVNINFLNLWESIYSGNVHNIFFVLTYYDDITDTTVTLSTERLIDVWTHEDRYFNFNYYVPVDDTGTSKDFVMMTVADNAGGFPLYDDIKLDMEDTAQNYCDYPLTFYYSNGHTEYYAHGDLGEGFPNPNSECEVGFYVETVIAPKSNLIIVNSTEENSDLYVVGANSYRYTADGQVYMLYITVPGNSAHFASGVNTIIVPRYLALESQLNSTLTSNPSGSELSGGEFYSTDDSQAFSSGHIIAVIEKTMGNTEAENLLYRLTHDPTNAQIANIVQVSGEALYRIHLPAEVQPMIPYNIQSSAIGEPYDFLTVGEVLEFVFDCLVWIGTTLYNLAEMVYEAGIELVCGLTNSVLSTIQSAVDKIVDAFQAFVTWAVDFVSDAFSALIAQPLQALYSGLESWANGLASLVSAAARSIENGTDNALASFLIYQYIVESEVFKILMAIGISLFAIITAASFLGPCGFIASMVAPLLVNILVSGMTAAAFTVAGVVDVSTWVLSTLVDILGDDLVGGMAGVMGATIGTIGWIASLMSAPIIDGFIGFAFSSLGAILSWYGAMVSDWTASFILDSVGVGLAAFGVWKTIIKPDPILSKYPTANGILKGITIIEAGISVFELTTTVASHD